VKVNTENWLLFRAADASATAWGTVVRLLFITSAHLVSCVHVQYRIRQRGTNKIYCWDVNHA
jgi:hypothetical protein